MFRIFEFIYTYRLALLCTLPGLVVAPELYYSILKLINNIILGIIITVHFLFLFYLYIVQLYCYYYSIFLKIA